MTNPTPERIAAALALAEVVDGWFLAGGSGVQLPPWIAPTLSAYRATAPKLRTRAEVDAERLRNLDAFRANTLSSTELCMRDSILCREPIAPEPAAVCVDCELSRHEEPTVAVRWDGSWRCADCASKKPLGIEPLAPEPAESEGHEQAPEACSCEQSEHLTRYLQQIKVLHQQWSGGAVRHETAPHILTAIGNVILRWDGRHR